MKALVKTKKGPGNIEVQERAMPTIRGDDWVLIKVKAAGVCGTDLHIWHDQFLYWPPVILGHEFSGEIVEVGKKVANWKVGDRVVAEPHALSCGVCELCRKGQIQSCKSKRSPGWGIDGAFAEYVTMPASLLHRIPEKVSYELAAITEPLAVAVHQVLERGRVEFQDTVVITGTGPIGILAAFVARKAGASKIIATGITRTESLRFPLCKELGADICLASGGTFTLEEDPVKAVLELTEGRGADLVIEASGNAVAVNQAFEMVRIGGRISAIGISGKPNISVPWDKAILKVNDIYFNMSSSYTSWPKAISALENNATALRNYITCITTIDSWETMFGRLEEEQEVKVLFIP